MSTFFSRILNKLIGKEETEQEEMEFYLKNPTGSTLTAEQLFNISLDLIISEQNRAYIDSLETGPTVYPQKQMMQRNWRITNGEEALAFMEARLEEGHRKIFNRLLELYSSQGVERANRVDFTGTEFESKETDEEDNEEEDYAPDWQYVIGFLENLDEVYKLPHAEEWLGKRADLAKTGTDAWDFGRVVFVARVCYSLGYISETEAWQSINQIAEMARQKYTNWEDYAKSYVLGRAMWGGNDGEWENLIAFASDALVAPQSPWQTCKW